MEPNRGSGTAAKLNDLPSIDELLRTQIAVRLDPVAGHSHLTTLARDAVESLRVDLRNQTTTRDDHSALGLLDEAANRLEAAWTAEQRSGTRRVINATGVIIHTNLGRAPLSPNARRAVADEASGYCTLEYDINTGKRGKRGERAEALIAELTGAEAALIVNNCAAALFLVLKALADGGEVVISRGELVEIGGDFRIPDVLEQSGAVLREVGTTNRTKLADYERAIGENTRMLLRVHPSNYRIVGFTAMPDIAELAETAHKHGILIYEDIGSGALLDLTQFGLSDEPVVSRSIRAGVDIVTFSGDKLLGSVQAGIVAGKSEIIARLKKHPLYRALRVDKLAYAALEATLGSYRRETALVEIPVLRMISMKKEEIAGRVGRFAEELRKSLPENCDLNFEIIDGISAIGGGAAPTSRLETVLLALTHEKLTAAHLEYALRNSTPPVITRIVDDKVLIDLRTVSESEECELLDALSHSAVQNPA